MVLDHVLKGTRAFMWFSTYIITVSKVRYVCKKASTTDMGLHMVACLIGQCADVRKYLSTQRWCLELCLYLELCRNCRLANVLLRFTDE